MRKRQIKTSVMGAVALFLSVALAGTAAAGEMIDPAALARHVRVLASDDFEGRAPGTAGERKTVAYIISQMQAAGLSPGVAGGWTQDVPLVAVEVSSGSGVTVPGPQPIMLHQGADLLMLPPDVTGTEPSKRWHLSSQLVFVGRGAYDKAAGVDDYKGLDLRGKIALMLEGGPGEPMMEVTRRGVAAVIVVPADDSTWNARAYLLANRLGEATDVADAQTVPAIRSLIRRAAAQRLVRASGRELASLEAAALEPNFRPLALGNVDLNLHAALRRYVSRNVVGVLPGREKPGEHVLYMAHWDHIGRCPGRTDDICNGALDNASGVAGMLELAKAFGRAPSLARSVTFVATTAEEMGLLGARWFATHSPVPNGQIVGGFSIESIALRGRGADVVVLGEGLSELDDYIARAAAAQGRRVTAMPEAQSSFPRSDHFAMAETGVPMLMATGLFARNKDEAGLTADVAASYVKERYHQPGDDLDGPIRFDGAAQDVDLVYRVGRELAAGEDWPNWREGTRFRAIRDESRRERP